MITILPEVQKLKDAIETGKCSLLDSVISPLIRKLVARFAADGVDMTVLWIRTPQSWACPGCGRSKEHIVRLNSKKQLMCRLVEHHDHMKDLLLERFRDISASQQIVVADETAGRFAKRSASMVSSYDNTVICDDCNAADAKAKKLVGTHPKYSYSANEIHELIIPKPNQPHEIDKEVAARIWKANEATFQLRLKIIDRIATIAATDSHWYQETDWQCRHENVVETSEGILRSYGLHCLPYYDLRGETQRIQRDYSSWRKNTTDKIIVPTDGEVNHTARVTSAAFWKKVKDDWRCPVCQRTKHETVRKNKKAEWYFDYSEKWYRDNSEQLGKKRHTICTDCGWVAERLAEEAIKTLGYDLRRYSSWIELDDIASIIVPRAHARHIIKNDEADLVVASIIDRIRNEHED